MKCRSISANKLVKSNCVTEFKAQIKYSLTWKKSLYCFNLTNYLNIGEKVHSTSPNDFFFFSNFALSLCRRYEKTGGLAANDVHDLHNPGKGLFRGIHLILRTLSKNIHVPGNDRGFL